MAESGVELILGLRRDPQFGPVVLVGLGGTLTEVLDDVAVRLAPLDIPAALSMLDQLRGARMLDGVRGRPPVDRAAVASMLVALGRLGVERPDVFEVDLNPVMASADGAVAVDALVVVKRRIDDR
jgi:acetyltransferase